MLREIIYRKLRGEFYVEVMAIRRAIKAIAPHDVSDIPVLRSLKLDPSRSRNEHKLHAEIPAIPEISEVNQVNQPNEKSETSETPELQGAAAAVPYVDLWADDTDAWAHEPHERFDNNHKEVQTPLHVLKDSDHFSDLNELVEEGTERAEQTDRAVVEIQPIYANNEVKSIMMDQTEYSIKEVLGEVSLFHF